MSIRIEFDTHELERAIRKLGPLEAAAQMAAATFEAGQLVADTIKKRAPDSGLSRGDSRKKKRGKLYSGKLSEDVIVKEARVDERGALVRVVSLPYYTGMVERGTSKQAPQPYIRRGAKTAEPGAREKMVEGLNDLLRKAFR